MSAILCKSYVEKGKKKDLDLYVCVRPFKKKVQSPNVMYVLELFDPPA